MSDRHDDAEAGGCMFGAYLNPGTGGWVERHDSAQAEPEVPDRSAATLPVVVLSRTCIIKTAVIILPNVEVVEAGGAGFKIVEVLEGRADAYVHSTRIKGWDVCAGDALLRAAGSGLVDLEGKSLQYDASKPVLEGGVLASCARVKCGKRKFLAPSSSRTTSSKVGSEKFTLVLSWQCLRLWHVSDSFSRAPAQLPPAFQHQMTRSRKRWTRVETCKEKAGRKRVVGPSGISSLHRRDSDLLRDVGHSAGESHGTCLRSGGRDFQPFYSAAPL